MPLVKMLALATMLAAPLTANAIVLAGGIADGGFETKGGALPVTDYCYDGFATPGGPACAAGAWSGNGIIRSGSGAWGGTTTPDGNYYAFVQGAGVLSQTFTADSSGVFTLSWLDAGRSNNGGAQTYEVSVTDALISTQPAKAFRFSILPPVNVSLGVLGSFTTSPGQAFTGRSSGSFTLTAGSSYVVSFTGLVAADVTSFIDSVALVPSAVPEPASWSLLIVGFAAVGAAARRRRTALAA